LDEPLGKGEKPQGYAYKGVKFAWRYEENIIVTEDKSSVRYSS